MNKDQIVTTSKNQSLLGTCAQSCQKLLARLQNVRNALASEFRQVLGTRNRMLDLALTEAESLSRETGYPQLVFPLLAREKAEAVVDWNRRQSEIRRPRLEFAVG